MDLQTRQLACNAFNILVATGKLGRGFLYDLIDDSNRKGFERRVGGLSRTGYRPTRDYVFLHRESPTGAWSDARVVEVWEFIREAGAFSKVRMGEHA